MDYKRSKDFDKDENEVLKVVSNLENHLELTFSLLKERGIKEEVMALGFIDETKLQNISNTARVWSFEKVKSIKNTTKFGESVKGFLDNSNRESIVNFLEIIKRANERYKAIVAIIDNFSFHKSSLVRKKAKELGIYMVYLPPYSPDLNPIEYIWKSIKRILSLIFVKDLEDMKRAISEAWNKFSRCLSYAEGWIKRFLKSDYFNYAKLCG